VEAERAVAIPSARIPADEPTDIQTARAAQRGRGRSADSPLAIPWLGWRDILCLMQKDSVVSFLTRCLPRPETWWLQNHRLPLAIDGEAP